MTQVQRPKGGFPALSIRRLEGAECKGIGEPLRGPLEPEKHPPIRRNILLTSGKKMIICTHIKRFMNSLKS